MDQNPLRTGEPVVGLVKREDAEYRNGGKMIFISRSAPFEKNGKKVCRVCSVRNKKRQKKNELRNSLGLTGKQFRRWVKENRKKEAKTRNQNGGENAGTKAA